MKKLLFLCIVISAFTPLFSQPVSDTTIINTLTDTSGNTYYQIINQNAGEVIDSANFVDRVFTEAHNARLPIRRAINLLARQNEVNQQYGYLNSLLQATSGQNYFQLAKAKGYARDIPGIWRIIGQVDTVDVNAFFEFNQNGLGTQINSLNDPTPVPGGLTVRFSPFEVDYFRVTQLFPTAIDIVFLFEIEDENNPNSAVRKRMFYSNEVRNGPGGVRAIKFPNP